MRPLVDIRKGERRAVAGAFLVLFGIMAAHTLLETARDAMFLSKLRPDRLPWVYLAIAAVGLALSRVGDRRAVAPSRHTVPFTLLAAAGITLGFWVASSTTSPVLLYALYVWSGTFASWVIVQFWLLLGEAFTVVQAKRLFGLVGAGSVLGAVVGAGGASLLASSLPARHLLLVGAGVLAATAAVAALRLLPPPSTKMSMPARPTSIGSDVRAIFDRPYTTRILLVVLLSTLAFTCIDYVFKAAVARRVGSAQLGVFFANVYLVLNAIALAIQLGCVSLLLRTLGVQRTAQVLPSFLLLAAGGVVAGGGLVAALLLKGADGVLRHSLHRTSTELMFVPLEDRVRSRIKPVIDLVGQRGGQALASLGILGLVSLGGTEIALGAAVIALTLGWIWVSTGIQRHYLNLFRDNLRAGRLDYQGDLPELDLHALEAVFGALNSDRDAEVLAALELLSLQKKQRLIPALLLYHPSRRVVLQTLQVFVSEGRTDFTPIAQRLLSHPEPEVRAAALRAWAAVARDEAVLADLLQDPDLEVRATALVSLESTGLMSDEETAPAIAALAEDPAPAVRIALARAMGEQPHARFEPVLERLAGASEPEVRSEVAWAMGRSQNPRFLPILLAFLEYRLESNAAQAACVAIGSAALAMLDATMGDPAASARVRRNIPRAIAQFEPEVAAPILLRHLRDTIDGMLRFRILLALRRLRSLEPGVELDPQILGSVMEASVRSALRSLAWRLTLEDGAREVAARNTPVLALMIGLLRDRESHALSRLFRLLALRHPAENIERIQRGLAKPDAKSRASSRELIEHLIETPLRDAVLALIEDLSDAERLVRAPAGYRAPPVAYPRLLELLIAAGDELGTLAMHHAGELGVGIVGSPGPDDRAQGVLRRALASRGAQVGHAG